MVRANSLKVKQKVNSVDEQIIPSKIKRSRIWQFNRKKTVKWAFKMFLRARSSGIMYNFFLYSGKGSVGAENYFSKGSVMRLVKHLPQHKYHTLRLANWFTTIPLMLKIESFWYNCIRYHSLKSDTKLSYGHWKRIEEIWMWFIFIQVQLSICYCSLKIETTPQCEDCGRVEMDLCLLYSFTVFVTGSLIDKFFWIWNSRHSMHLRYLFQDGC